MKTLSLVTVGLLIFAATGLAEPGGGSSAGTAAATGGGHAASAAPAAHASSASAGVSHAALGGGFRSSGVATSGARASFGGGVGVGRSPGIAGAPAGTMRALSPVPTVHNAWSDPVGSRVAGTAASPQYAQANRVRTGQTLYSGADGYVPSRPASGHLYHGQGGNHGAGGYRRAYYNNFPYPVYYPYLYGGYGYGGVGDYGTAGDYAGLTSDNNVADLGAPDFSNTPNNYYSYVAPTPDASNADRAAAPPQALPDAPAVGPQNPSNAEKSTGDSQGPDSLVEAVQDELIKRGYFGGKADSLYGAATRDAIRRFQTDQGLPATGRINEATLRALHLD